MKQLKDEIVDLIFKSDNKIVPAIVQDDKTLKVLMLGYMNRESYQKTIDTKLVTFYSRSRETLWIKGETSGNYLNLVSIESDCDYDALLVRADTSGVVCHRGTASCFNNLKSEGFCGKLTSTIRERHKNLPEGSYTTKLFSAGIEKIAKKVGEEASETIIEAIKGDKKRLVYESADLIYHLIVLLEYFNLSLKDIDGELYARSIK